jgi:predicted Zn-dependent peptidase
MYEDAPDDIVHDLLSQAVYEQHPLGLPILGTEETLSTFTSDTLKQYVHDMYTPEKVVISIAGNVDETFIKEVESYFGSFERGKEQTQIVKPAFHQNKLIRKKETEQAHLCLGFNGLKIGDENMYSLTVLNNILGGSMSSRLFQDVREARGLAYSVYSYHSSYQDSGILTIYGGTGANQLDSLYETIHQTLETFKLEGVTDKEINNCKEQLKGSLMLSLESTNSRMSRNGKNELMLGMHRSLDDIIVKIDAVTKERVHELTNSIFTEHSLSLVSPLENWKN